jgi:molybdate transport system substrate-binding protein
VAAAADLQPVMPALAQRYEHETGVKLVVSFGSSATLVEQILNGAPFDIFLGADYVFPEKVVAAGLADAAQPTAYAKGTLVLWTRKDRLTDPRVKTVALANQLHAPYGRAAVAALRNMKLYDKVSPHFVVGENISQAAQFVESGNAQLGLISMTAASTEHFKEIGTYLLVPTSQYPEIRQCAVIMSKSELAAFSGDSGGPPKGGSAARSVESVLPDGPPARMAVTSWLIYLVVASVGLWSSRCSEGRSRRASRGTMLTILPRPIHKSRSDRAARCGPVH